MARTPMPTTSLLDRLGLWFGLLDQGLRTVIEHPEPTRSQASVPQTSR